MQKLNNKHISLQVDYQHKLEFNTLRSQMINHKSKNKQLSSTKTFSTRPKRCHICQKMINAQKYDQHFGMCYRFEKDKVDHQAQSIKKERIKPKNTPIRQIVNKGNAYKLIQPKNNFRIKNVSLTLSKNENRVKDKNQSNIFNPENQRNFRSTSEANRFGTKKQIKKQQKKIQQLKSDYKRQTEKSQKNQQKKTNFKNEPKKQEKKIQIKQENYRQTESRNLHQRQKNTSQIQNECHNSSSSQNQSQLRLQIEHQNERFIQPVAQNHTFINHNNLENQVEQSQQQQPSQRNLIQQPRANHTTFISQLVSNTAQIINFINRLNINDQTLDVMVQQLNHVNQIAQQVVELNALGNSLGFTMETIFGPRIQQLQNTIISQVSMAILRSFNNRLTSQFQQLIDRNPSLRHGFSKQQIQNTFKIQKCKKQGECPICLQQYPKQTFTIQLQCKHIFHDDCINNWFNSSKNCPMCRQVQKLAN